MDEKVLILRDDTVEDVWKLSDEKPFMIFLWVYERNVVGYRNLEDCVSHRYWYNQ